MRQAIEAQLKIGQVDIDKIEIDLRCRDEIPQLLSGMQAIYRDKPLRNKVFGLLETIIPEDVDPDTGRPGMDLCEAPPNVQTKFRVSYAMTFFLEILLQRKLQPPY